MSELKTLKNWKLDFNDEDNFGFQYRKSTYNTKQVIKDFFERVIKEELKTNAIKCAKHYLKMREQHPDRESEYWYFDGRFDEVMERNNLTEKDLEEKENA